MSRRKRKSPKSRPNSRRRLQTEALETRMLLAADLGFMQNPIDPNDVNNDGIVAPVDALMIVNRLNQRDSTARNDGVFMDVNGDGQLAPMDALMVINRINNRDRGQGPDRDRPRDRPTDDPPSDSPAEVRSIDGTGNNVENPEFGSTDTELLRVADNDYADGISEPAGEDRPSAREISNVLSAADPEGTTSERNLSAFVFAWGQFLDHDITLSLTPEGGVDGESFDIEVPAGDPFFDPFNTGDQTIPLTRSVTADGSGTSTDNPAEQENAITAFVDGSQVYGSDQETSDSLRAFVGGRLLVSDDGLLPTDENGDILAGDIRAAENVVLTSMHALFVREHNRLADEISADNPSWTDEEIFQEARAIVIAELQSITYNEYLPALLGEDALSEYTGYDSSVNPGIANEFSTAAFRFGHSTLSEEFRLVGNDGEDVDEPLTLANAFFVPEMLEETGIDSFLKYASSTLSQEIDLEVVDSLRNFLFGPPGAGGFDLVSLNIQRGRDHGLADYNSTRVAYGLDAVESFADITSNEDVQANLESLYGDVDNIDLWVGLMAEDHTETGSLGETATAIISDQFERLRDGDRFYYENTMSDREVRAIEETTLGDIIQRNTNLDSLQSNVFFFAPEISGTVVSSPATPPQAGAAELVADSNPDRRLAGNAQPGDSEQQLGGLELQLGGQRPGDPLQGGAELAGGPEGQRGARGQDGVGQRRRGPDRGPREDRVGAVEGILMELVDGAGNVIDSVLTDANGEYAFTSVTQSGSYQVRVADSGEWAVAGSDTWDLSISNGDEDMDRINFRVVLA